MGAASGTAPGTDAAEVIRAVSAPLYYRMLISGDPVDEATADQAAEAAFVVPVLCG